MRSTKPEILAFISAAIAVAALVLFYTIHYYLVGERFTFLSLLGLIAALFASIYFVNKYILSKFIYDKIKLIYKTIHSLKLNKEEKYSKLNQIKGDAISTVSNEVVEWAQNKTDEIEQLKKLEVFRKEFLGNVSHELKTPIFNIQGYVLTLLNGAYKDQQVAVDYLGKTERNIERMISIVEELETISRYETGEFELEKTSFDIISLTKEVIDFLEPSSRSKEIKLFIVNDNLPSKLVFADRLRIRHVLTNLLSNSIKYGRQGGRTKVSLYDMDENILIEVSDNGIGISAEHLPRLFERFYRVDKSRSRLQGGSGLGLAIVKHILEAHKQTINVRSKQDVGSTFSFTLKKSGRIIL